MRQRRPWPATLKQETSSLRKFLDRMQVHRPIVIPYPESVSFMQGSGVAPCDLDHQVDVPRPSHRGDVTRRAAMALNFGLPELTSSDPPN